MERYEKVVIWIYKTYDAAVQYDIMTYKSHKMLSHVMIIPILYTEFK